jgi:cytoskeletal protein RodZ
MKTVGQALRYQRNKLNLTLAEAEKATKIRAETLSALEGDDFAKLPSSTYIKGFIRNYGEYLGLDSGTLLALYRRQYDEGKTPTNKILPDLKPKDSPKAILTPKRLLVVGLSVLVLGFLGYLFAQYQSFAAAPALQVDSPNDNLRVNNGIVEVVGRTDPDASLSINGQQVDLTTSGAFSVSVTLPDGTTDLTITASNKLGRVTTAKRTITVATVINSQPVGPIATSPSSPAVAAASASSNPITHQSQAPPSPLQVDLRIGPSAAWVSVNSDGATFQGILGAGVLKSFKANTKIVVQTGNGGSTDVILNGVDQGKIGNDLQVVTKEYDK